jgi:hypothetical protein
MGKHQELLDKYPNGTYASFCAKQQSAEAEAAEENNEKEADDGIEGGVSLEKGESVASQEYSQEEMEMKAKCDANDEL